MKDPRSLLIALVHFPWPMKSCWNLDCLWFLQVLTLSFKILYCCSVTKSSPTLRNPMNCSTPGFSVLYYVLKFTQTHVHWVGDAIQPSHPLWPPSPPALNLSQHQVLFQWVGSLHQVAKVLAHQSFQWIFRIDFLWDWLIVVQGTLKSLFQHHSSKASTLQCSAFLMVQLFMTPGTAACQTSLSFTISQSLLKLMSVVSMMLSNHLFLCCLLLLLPLIFPSIMVFSNQLALCIRWWKYWSFSFGISPSNVYLGLISFRIGWFDLFDVQGLSRIFSSTTIQKHQFFGVQPSLWSNSHIHTWPLGKP